MPKIKGIDQAAKDKKVQARRAANRKRAAQRKAERKASGKKGFLEGVVGSLKKASKGSKEYQEAKVRRKAAKVKKAEGKSWARATKRRKKAGGPTMNTLIKARTMLKPGSDDYKKIQNLINKAYGSRVRHKVGEEPKVKAPAPKKAKVTAPKAPLTPKPKVAKVKAPAKDKVVKVKAPSKPDIRKIVKNLAKDKAPAEPEPTTYSPYVSISDRPSPELPKSEDLRKKYPPATKESRPARKFKYEGGGKVESNPYGWPSRDARNGGKK